MRYVAAYLLAVLGGNASPKAQDIKKILSSVGIDADDASVTKVIGELSGKNIEDLIASGKEKLASVPSAGAVVSGGAAPAAAAAADSAPAAADKKEEKKDDSDQSDDDMGFGLFD